jgi:predicted enzyme related to lactoylglutathione lyase
MNNPVIWFEIYVENMPRARAFYERLLGVTLERLNSPDSLDGIELWAFPMEMDRVGAGGALVKMDGVRPGGGGTLFKAKMPIGEYGHIALVHDTEGNLVGLHSMQ